MVLPVFQYFPNYNLRDFVSNFERFESGIGIPNVTEATSPGTRYAATEVEGKQLIQRVTENKVKKCSVLTLSSLDENVRIYEGAFLLVVSSGRCDWSDSSLSRDRAAHAIERLLAVGSHVICFKAHPRKGKLHFQFSILLI